MSCITSRIVSGFLLFAAFAPYAAADPIVEGTTYLPGTAIQDITLLPNTPFNPTDSPILFDDLFGIGSITINRDTQVGSTIPIQRPRADSSTAPTRCWEALVFGNIPPLTGADFSGIITGVVQDPSDPGFPTGQPSSFQSGDFSFGGASFGFEFLDRPGGGAETLHRSDRPFLVLLDLRRPPPFGRDRAEQLGDGRAERPVQRASRGH